MTETELNITTIGLDVGYDTLSTFNRNFMRLAGKTPSAFRADRRFADPAASKAHSPFGRRRGSAPVSRRYDRQGAGWRGGSRPSGVLRGGRGSDRAAWLLPPNPDRGRTPRRELGRLAAWSKGMAQSNVLEVRHISKSFPGVQALDDVSFSVKAVRSMCCAARTARANRR